MIGRAKVFSFYVNKMSHNLSYFYTMSRSLPAFLYCERKHLSPALLRSTYKTMIYSGYANSHPCDERTRNSNIETDKAM